jgi:hypothetical protein
MPNFFPFSNFQTKEEKYFSIISILNFLKGIIHSQNYIIQLHGYFTNHQKEEIVVVNNSQEYIKLYLSIHKIITYEFNRLLSLFGMHI